MECFGETLQPKPLSQMAAEPSLRACWHYPILRVARCLADLPLLPSPLSAVPHGSCNYGSSGSLYFLGLSWHLVCRTCCPSVFEFCCYSYSASSLEGDSGIFKYHASATAIFRVLASHLTIHSDVKQVIKEANKQNLKFFIYFINFYVTCK